MATGGTPAPSAATTRASGAAQALGAPKVVGSRSQRSTPGQRPPGAKTRPSGKPPGKAGAQAGAQHPLPPAHPGFKAAPPRQPAGQNVFNPNMNAGQLERLAQNVTKGQLENQLSPLRQQAGEIRGTQQTVENRYGNAANITNQTLAGLAGQTAEGAKTYQNQLADSALKASKGIETAGQDAVTRTGGALDPQVQAALNAQAQRSGEVTANQKALASSLGQGEENYMANIRAAAAQRATEGRANIASTYGKQLGANQAQQQKLIVAQPTAAKSLDVELGQKQFTDRATEAGLKIKIGALAQQGAQSRAHDQVTERGQNLTFAGNRENVAQRETASQRTANAARERNAISQLNATDKAAYDRWRMSQPGGVASPAAGRKYAQTVNNALSTVKAELARGEKKGFKGQQLYNIAVKQLGEGKYTGKGGVEPGNPMGQNLIHAALSIIYNKGKLVGKPRSEALEAGLEPSSQWLR